MEDTETFVFYLCPDYPMVPLASAIEVLDMANKVLGAGRYKWLFASSNGDPVPAANSITSKVDLSLSGLRKLILTGDRPEAVLVCAGVDVQNHENKSLLAALRESGRQKILVGGISTGTFLIAASGLLRGKNCVVHWEIMEQFKQRFPDANVLPDLYEIDGQFCTCAGGLSAMDMMLALLTEKHGQTIIQEVCNKLLTDRIRSPHQRQRLLKSSVDTHDKLLATVVDLMEKNIAQPLSIEEISQMLGCSRRHIERKFEIELGCSPARFYLRSRLEHADYLLRNSTNPVSRVAEESGFRFFSHFSKAYRTHFGITPKQVRDGKAP
ncbi:MAG: GlxA family transcriptional regulator [Rhizobiaceae bacterium]